MTEDEAKEKWCPLMSRPFSTDVDCVTYCKASECMAWRWSMIQTSSGILHDRNEKAVWLGYCGLAGNP